MKRLIVLALLGLCHGIDWESSSFYNIFIDRFARTDGGNTTCKDLNGYCGGTFRGIQKNLDYIVNLGFNTVWLSDVLSQSEGSAPIGFPSDFYTINPEYGGSDDFKDLIAAIHGKKMQLVVDVNLNNIGLSGNVPFDRQEYFHDNCTINYSNATSVEWCWFEDKYPDIAQEHPFVRRVLVEWVNFFVQEYEIDGLSFLKSVFVPKDFWAEITQTTTIFTYGSVLKNTDIETNAAYQGALQSVMNHPLNYVIINVFSDKLSMKNLPSFLSEFSSFSNPDILINFLSGLDYPRFLSIENNPMLFRNAAAFILTYVGIPSVYYGEEQNFSGGNFPENSAPLWGYMDPGSPSYKWFATLMKFRSDNLIWKEPWVIRDFDDEYLIASRGETLMCFTNRDTMVSLTITESPFYETQVICNVFNSTDCSTITDGKVSITLQGEVKLYQPQAQLLIAS